METFTTLKKLEDDSLINIYLMLEGTKNVIHYDKAIQAKGWTFLFPLRICIFLFFAFKLLCVIAIKVLKKNLTLFWHVLWEQGMNR